ncbi:MAG: hypothetical protein IT369_03335 [Candidatus Latescibacteria bacterium]|nr:hypothetical protein [Candidatus Latescibacterota bacterium]
MPLSPPNGIALLGSTQLPLHLAAIRQTAGLQVVGHWSAGAGTVAAPARQDPAELVCQPQVRAVVLCLDAPEREFWAREAIRAGKMAVCFGLPALTYLRLRGLVVEADQAGVHLVVIPPLDAGAASLRGLQAGRVLVSLNGRLPQDLLRHGREGLLHHWGAFCLQLLAERHGRLDSVYARTRSLGLNRPEEDMVSAQLRFTNGVEGVVSLVALAADSEVILEEWGEGERQCHRLTWSSGDSDGPGQGYAALAACLEMGCPPPVWMHPPLEGVRWAEWLAQSARLDREVFANEVVHG